MTISISIDNDRSTVAVDTLTIDESAGVQTPVTTDHGNEIDLTLSSGSVGGFTTAFNTFLNGTMFGSYALSSAQKTFASTIDGASSAADYVKVTTTNGENISGLFFSDSAGQPLDGDQVAGMTTLDGLNVYLWSDGDFCLATTSNTAGAGRVVAAFYLNEAANHLSAQIQMATFEPISHPDANNPDDSLNFTDVLNVSAMGTLSFNFDNLKSGAFLWAAVGGSSAGLLVTGQDLNVVDSGGKLGDLVSGGADPSDTVNTSQGGIGATIGINSQHFADVSGSGGTKLDGPVGVFTLVSGFVPLQSAAQATGGNVNDIDYSSYINAPSAKIFISQTTGSSSIGGAVRITLWEAGGSTLANPTGDHAAASLIPEEGYSGANSYIGDQDTDSHLRDDFAVGVDHVTVMRGAATYTWTAANSGAVQSGITVTISGNTITAKGLATSDTVGFAAVNDPANPLDGTFNRFDLQALANSNAVDIGRVDLDQGVSVSKGVGSTLIVDDDGPSITASATNAPTLTVDESAFGTDATAAFAPQFTPAYGTDGQAVTPVTYALSTPGGDSGLVDTASGHAVWLFVESGVVVGRQGTSALNAAAGDIVFSVAVDGSGNVTLDGRRAVVHADATNPDDSRSLSAANLVVLTATAHDGDGDHAAAPLNIGQLLVFKDDGPSITASATNAPTLTVDESAFGTNATAAFAPQFSPVYGADGQGATPVTYALSTPGGDSGLVDTATGNTVWLFLESGQVVGRQGSSALAAATGDIVFAVSVDSSGNVTLDGRRAIVHSDTTNPDDSRSLSAANLVALTATATDKDGDHASAPLNIGQLLVFKDDGPSITASATNAPTLTVDESAFGTNATAGFAPQFSPVYGADGQGATPVTYALSTPGGDCGLVDTATGNAVWLFLESGQVVGRQGTSALAAATGDIVFAVSVDSSGNVTLDGRRAIVHSDTTNPDDSRSLSAANLVALTATATDKDGDHASAPLNIGQLLVFKDDGPSITASATNAPTLMVDESAFGTNATAGFAPQFSPAYGADGQGATPVTYALSTPGGDSGLVDSVTGHTVWLFLETGQVVGREGATASTAATGQIVFTVAVDGSGNVTLDGRRAVVHADATNPDDSKSLSAANLVVLTATANDKDGDHASAPLNIGQLLVFKDDGPSITAQITGGHVAFAADATGTISGSLHGAVGADVDNATQQTITNVKEYTISTFDNPHAVYADLTGVLSADKTTLTYYTTHVAADQNATTAAYQLSLDQTANSGAGSYTFAVLKPPPVTTTHFGFGDLPSGQNLLGIIATDKAHLDQGGLLVLPTNPAIGSDGAMTNVSGTVNTSKGGGPVTIGNGNQAFDHTYEGAWFVYVDNPDPAAVGGLGLTQVTADDADTVKFDGTNTATDASVQIVQASGKGTTASPGPGMQITAYDINPQTVGHLGDTGVETDSRAFVLNPIATDAQVNVIGVKIHDATGKVIEYATVTQAAGATNAGALHDVTGDGQVTAADNSAVDIQFKLDNVRGAGTADDIYSVIVNNLKANYTIEFLTDTAHNAAKVQNIAGSYDLGGFNIMNTANVPAQDFNFSVQIHDFDNDAFGGAAVPVANFSVEVNGLFF